MAEPVIWFHAETKTWFVDGYPSTFEAAHAALLLQGMPFFWALNVLVDLEENPNGD